MLLINSAHGGMIFGASAVAWPLAMSAESSLFRDNTDALVGGNGLYSVCPSLERYRVIFCAFQSRWTNRIRSGFQDDSGHHSSCKRQLSYSCNGQPSHLYDDRSWISKECRCNVASTT